MSKSDSGLVALIVSVGLLGLGEAQDYVTKLTLAESTQLAKALSNTQLTPAYFVAATTMIKNKVGLSSELSFNNPKQNA
jgi:hypothetical protein